MAIAMSPKWVLAVVVTAFVLGVATSVVSGGWLPIVGWVSGFFGGAATMSALFHLAYPEVEPPAPTVSDGPVPMPTWDRHGPTGRTIR